MDPTTLYRIGSKQVDKVVTTCISASVKTEMDLKSLAWRVLCNHHLFRMEQRVSSSRRWLSSMNGKIETDDGSRERAYKPPTPSPKILVAMLVHLTPSLQGTTPGNAVYFSVLLRTGLHFV
uniref:Uncharacterized protein n=1 Tax=Grammatophora oceanica TaxID=210454 RepID=A0A7S1UNC0_9STRA|mmetsp:Transcript_14083/g.20631  ORF Transcript_14083/g.20631 Transcript_14083/m.20631 type:complete len:121 (+) Transcript_14083:207-569(+)